MYQQINHKTGGRIKKLPRSGLKVRVWDGWWVMVVGNGCVNLILCSPYQAEQSILPELRKKLEKKYQLYKISQEDLIKRC